MLDFIRWCFPFICWSDLVIIFRRLLLLWFIITDFQMLHLWNASYLDIVCNSFYGLWGFFYFVGDFASMFVRGICVQFFSFNFFLWFWCSSIILTSQKGIRRCSFCFYFLGEIVENSYHFFLKFLIELISGNLWVCYCLYWKLISYRLNFFNRYDLFRVCIFLCESGAKLSLQAVSQLNLSFL